MTLYDQNPAAWNEIAVGGWPNVAAMAKRFSSYKEMDDALGYVKAVANWARRGGQVSAAAEQSAKNWLAANPAPQEQAAQGTMMLVVVPAGMDAKVTKVLGILGCDVTEV